MTVARVPIRFSPAGLKFGWGGEMKIRKGGTRPGVWCEPRRAERGGQSCAYEAPGMAHGDADMPDVHVDSRAVDHEPRPTAADSSPTACERPETLPTVFQQSKNILRNIRKDKLLG